MKDTILKLKFCEQICLEFAKMQINIYLGLLMIALRGPNRQIKRLKSFLSRFGGGNDLRVDTRMRQVYAE